MPRFECNCPPDNCAERVSRYLGGDSRAGDELARKFEGLVRRIVQRVLGPGRREEWGDVCQLAFLRLFSRLGQWGRACPFCKWLMVVVANQAINYSRSVAGRPLGSLPAGHEVVDQHDDTSELEQAEWRQRVRACIEATVAGFPPELKRVYLWRYEEDLPINDIAGRENRSPSTIHYRLAAIRERLLPCIQER